MVWWSFKAILEATVKYGNGFLFLTDKPLEKFKETTKEIIEIMKYYERRRISLAPSLSYLNGLGEKTSEWISKIEFYIKLNVDTIIIDFSQTNIPPKKAIIVLKNSLK